MKRRTIIFGGTAAVLTAGGVLISTTRRGAGEEVSKRSYNWSVSELRSGGTAGCPTDLPAAAFRSMPQCVVTLEKMRGPCQTSDVPIRHDITEGVAGLPLHVNLRIVDAENCAPLEGADVEIWHADARGVYSGRAAAMCNPDNEAARQVAFLRGRQITGQNGTVSFLTVYPGWYPGRANHIHMCIVKDDRELLISQLLFDDSLNDLIYSHHPDYAGRARRDTMNGGDMVFDVAEAEFFIFDVEKLEAGLLQASYTIGTAS